MNPIRDFFDDVIDGVIATPQTDRLDELKRLIKDNQDNEAMAQVVDDLSSAIMNLAIEKLQTGKESEK